MSMSNKKYRSQKVSDIQEITVSDAISSHLVLSL